MHVFQFKIYISAVFVFIAMNLTPYSPTVTWYMFDCANGVNVWVFGQVVVTALYRNGLTLWVAV